MNPHSVRVINLEHFFNALELLGIILMLTMTFVFQIVLNELPCPLCLLQRIGFIGTAIGFLFNLRFGLRPSHYAISLLSAIFTSFVALRQIALHVIPGTGSYGNAIFGLHLYTWSFIVSMVIVIVTIFMMSVDRQYQARHTKKIRHPVLTHILFTILALLVAANIISTFMVCGFHVCPENPTQYRVS